MLIRNFSLFSFTCLFCFFYFSGGKGKLAYAREDLIPGSRYTSGRAAAMGDAYIPLADDVASGLFYNPANLAKVLKTQFEPFNASFYSNVGNIPNIGNGTQVTSLSGNLSTLNKS